MTLLIIRSTTIVLFIRFIVLGRAEKKKDEILFSLALESGREKETELRKLVYTPIIITA